MKKVILISQMNVPFFVQYLVPPFYKLNPLNRSKKPTKMLTKRMCFKTLNDVNLDSIKVQQKLLFILKLFVAVNV